MIAVEKLFKTLNKNNIKFFSGVPDSILKNFSFYLQKHKQNTNFIAANEGSAVSIGIGHYLETGNLPCIYLQNSGLSNSINPLASIAHTDVYAIPLLLIIGWRGAPGIKDEPQHIVKGKITTQILKLLKIEYCILNNDKDLKKLDNLTKKALKRKKIVACLVKQNVLKYSKKSKNVNILKNHINKNEFFNSFLKLITKNSNIITSTGYTSRSLLKFRAQKNYQNKGKDFYMVGGMGHTSMVSLGVALKSKKKTYCIDGDGSLLMHMGSMHSVGLSNLNNFKHILFNNNCHDSVGGQKTNTFMLDFKSIVNGFGYKNYLKIDNKKNIESVLKKFIKIKGPSFLEVIVDINRDKNLPRPKNLTLIKKKFINGNIKP